MGQVPAAELDGRYYNEKIRGFSTRIFHLTWTTIPAGSRLQQTPTGTISNPQRRAGLPYTSEWGAAPSRRTPAGGL